MNNSNVSYNDCLNMALKFNNWAKAYTEFQKSFGLPIVEIPESIINDLKPEFATNEPLQTKVQNNDPMPDPPTQNKVIFKPLQSNSRNNKPSPKTRNQKQEQKKIQISQYKGPINENKPIKEFFNNEQDEIISNIRENYNLIDFHHKKKQK